MSYSSYDHDDLEPASTMRIERQIYFESGKADLSEAVKLPLAGHGQGNGSAGLPDRR